MPEIQSIILFIDIAKIIIAAAVVTILLRKFRQPTLFTYILAGVIIGPLVLGAAKVNLLGTIYTLGISQITPEITLLSALGTAFLLFSIGIETSIKRLATIGKPILIGTIIQVFAIIGITIALTVPTSLLPFDQALFIGTIIAFSSTMIIVKILSDKNEINTLSGRIMVSILLLQDFLVVLLVPLLVNASSIGNPFFIGWIIFKSLLLFGIAIFMNRFIFPHIFRIAVEEQELFFLISIATAFLFIGLHYLLDIPMAICAFVGGLSLSTLPYNLEIFAKIRALRDFFITIFFVALGLQLQFSFGEMPIILMVIIALVIFLIKPLVLYLVMMFAGYGSKMAVKVGISLGQVSEFGFDLAVIGGAAGIGLLSSGLFSFVITITAISMIITPYLTTSSSKIANFFYGSAENIPLTLKKSFFSRRIDELENVRHKKVLKDHIIIIGGGTVGRGLAKALNNTHHTVVVDNDPEVVSQGIKDGYNFVYGTSENPAIWEKLDLKDAKLIVVTILDHKEALNMVKSARNARPNITIFAMAHYFSHALDLYKHKVDFVAMPSIAGSNMFLQNISSYIETGKLYRINNFETEFMKYLEDQAEEEKRYKKYSL